MPLLEVAQLPVSQWLGFSMMPENAVVDCPADVRGNDGPGVRQDGDRAHDLLTFVLSSAGGLTVMLRSNACDLLCPYCNPLSKFILLPIVVLKSKEIWILLLLFILLPILRTTRENTPIAKIA
jgi:hypothetical protein